MNKLRTRFALWIAPWLEEEIDDPWEVIDKLTDEVCGKHFIDEQGNIYWAAYQ